MKTFSMRPQPGERLRTISCPVCGGNAFGLHWDCGEVRFVRCRGCGHLCQNPQPVGEDVKGRYDGEYFEYERENDAAFLELMLHGLQDVAFDHWVKELPQPVRVLDVGCATGALLEHLAGQYGFAAEGVEVCAPAARYGRERRGVCIHHGTLEEVGFAAGRFSLVHMSHVIEHLPDPCGAMRELHRVLAPGGRAVIVTPDAAGLQAQIFRSRWRSAIADHLHLFSRRGLRRLLEQTGFEIRARAFWGGLAQGSARAWLKRPVDRAAKRFGFGDVMLFVAERRSPSEETAGRSGGNKMEA